ncbi:MAG: hypothetical protein HDT01_04040 [Bacteroidales bacterium]|nr:hypothetical protein [Bacteroidales bacterium]
METNETRKSKMPKGALLILGIFMVLVYVGMGVLFFCDFFGWGEMAQPWPTLNYIAGVLLVIYGIYRGWRLYKGIGTPV